MLHIYVDELCKLSVESLLLEGKSRIVSLEKIGADRGPLLGVLKNNFFEVEEAIFQAGKLYAVDGESVYLVARKDASRLAIIACDYIFHSEPFLAHLNQKYQRETIRLSVAKSIRGEIEYFTLRILIAQSLSNSKKINLCIRSPLSFERDILEKYAPNINFIFYEKNLFSRFSILISIIWGGLRHLKKMIIPLAGFQKKETNDPSVLLLHEEAISLDKSYRSQPIWPINKSNFPVHVANFKSSIQSNFLPKEGLKANHINVVTASQMRAAWRMRKTYPILNAIQSDRRQLLKNIFKQNKSSVNLAALNIFQLLLESERLGSLAKWLNAKIFLVMETHNSSLEAMQIVSQGLGIKTLACQYSNLGFSAVGMISNADVFIGFSPIYKNIFQISGIKPKRYISNGYIYGGKNPLIADRAAKVRLGLMKNGAKFVVCYFDEAVQDDKWGLISRDHHLHELHSLLQLVVDDNDIGLIVKSQFVRYAPSRLYQNDELMLAAINTGRYLELTGGIHRNTIFPSEAAMSADLCIGHKYGATAALEAALLGVRTVLLNTVGAKMEWDFLIKDLNIEYSDVEQLTSSIAKYRKSNSEHKNLGDWSPIIDKFDEFRDGKASIRLRELLDDFLLHNGASTAI